MVDSLWLIANVRSINYVLHTNNRIFEKQSTSWSNHGHMKQMRYKKQKRAKKGGTNFWDREYKEGGGHLALSLEPSEDLEAFTRWLERRSGKSQLNVTCSVTDLGCGNGRNLIYLAAQYGMHGVGFDVSKEAVSQAEKTVGKDYQLAFEARSIAGAFPSIQDKSQTIVLDMMTSHFLLKAEREVLRKEVARILKPGGWYFLKTFLLDGDLNASRLLKENPAEETGSYIHPLIGVPEHVFTILELEDDLFEYFEVVKINKSHRHIKDGKAHKRRNVSLYCKRR